MSKYIVTTDSTADFPASYYTENNIPVSCLKYVIGDDTFVDDSGITMSNKDFYQKVREGALPTTSMVNIADYMDFFEPFLKDGFDILHLGFTSGLSGSYGSSVTAAEELMEKYPDRKIVTIDSLSAASGQGLYVQYVIDKRDAGMGYEEICEYAKALAPKVHHWFFPTNLTQLMRGGRVSKTSGFVGNLLNICPLLCVDVEGHLIPKAKVRGRKKAALECLAKMKMYADNRMDYDGKVFISHSDSIDDALYLKSLIEENFPKVSDIKIYEIGPVIGAHTGPGTAVLAFIGDDRKLIP